MEDSIVLFTFLFTFKSFPTMKYMKPVIIMKGCRFHVNSSSSLVSPCQRNGVGYCSDGVHLNQSEIRIVLWQPIRREYLPHDSDPDQQERQWTMQQNLCNYEQKSKTTFSSQRHFFIIRLSHPTINIGVKHIQGIIWHKGDKKKFWFFFWLTSSV